MSLDGGGLLAVCARGALCLVGAAGMSFMLYSFVY